MIILENIEKAKFDINNTNMSYYNDFLKPSEIEYYKRNKNRIGKVIQMTPREYYDDCAKFIFNQSASNLEKSRENENTEKYKDAMLSGETFPMCVIDYADKGQEGLHRMLAAAQLFGWNIKYPVLAIYVYDEQRENEWKMRKDLYAYIDWNFKEDCKEVCYKLEELPDIEPPINLLEMTNDFMNQINTDVEVKSELFEDRGNIKLKIIPISYKGIDVSDYIDPNMVAYDVFLEDIFDLPDDFDPDIIF